MMAPSARLQGLGYVTPLRQGDLSNLCGLYSVLNAIQLACWRAPPNSDQLRELLVFGFRHLTKRRLLARVIAFGMDQEDWHELGGELVNHCNSNFGTSLALEPLPLPSNPSHCTASEAIGSLKRVMFDGRPVLCSFGGVLDHYTVLSGYSEQRLTLFDSSGFRWVEQRSIGWSERSKMRHWLHSGGAIAVVDNW